MTFWERQKTDILWAGGIVLLATVLMGLMLNRFVTVVNHDSAIFCILGQSILQGHYLLVSEPNPQPYFTFPPLLPLQLAGLMAIFHNTDLQAMQLVFKGYIMLLFLISLPLFYAWLREVRDRKTAVVLTFLIALVPMFYKYTTDILSDTPYWAFSMGALYAAWRYYKADGKSWRWYALTVTLIICCALTRQIGMALVLGFLVTLGLQRQWKLLMATGVLLLFTAGSWNFYENYYRSHHRSDIDSLNQQGVQEVLDKSPIKLEYVKHFLIDRPVNKDENRLQTSPSVLLHNIWDRLIAYSQFSIDQLLPELKIKLNGQKLNLFHAWPFLLLFWALAVPGLVLLFRAFPFAAIYLGLYMGVLAVYPYISIRFILPTYPLILVCVWNGLALARAKLAQAEKPALKKLSGGLVPAFILLSLIAMLPDTIHWVKAGFKLKMADQGPSLRAGNKSYYQTLLWIKAHTPPDSLIISRKPPVTYFYSGRKSTAFPFTANKSEVFGYIQEKKSRYGKAFPQIYIFEDSAFGESTRYLKPALEAHQGQLILVYADAEGKNRVWQLK